MLPPKKKTCRKLEHRPPMCDGGSYFVESGPYREYCEKMQDQDEICTCTGLAAMDFANTKYLKGCSTTGVGMATCGCHEIVMPNGVGDLQKGERYGNIDYIWASTMRHWFKKLAECIKNLPPLVRLTCCFAESLPFCQDYFNLLYTLGAAMSDMEGIERIWSGSGLLGTSTREMGPGSRQNTIEDYWHNWNWRKNVSQGVILCKRLDRALKELSDQEDSFNTFQANQPQEVEAWKKLVENFEHGQSTENPFSLPKSGPTLQDIRLELAEEEKSEARESQEEEEEDELKSKQTTPAQYIYLLFEVEEQQRQLSFDIKKAHRRTRIEQQVNRVRALQRVHCPLALQILATTVPTVDIHGEPLSPPEAEDIILMFPSELPTNFRNPTLVSHELRYRDAQCSSSLHSLRHALLVKRRLYTFKNINFSEADEHIEVPALYFNNQQRKIDLDAASYRRARFAKVALVGEEAAGWRKLELQDVRMMGDEEEEKKKKQRAMKSRKERGSTAWNIEQKNGRDGQWFHS
ncbi:hypothetical protein BT96DRAFT_957616 [Gymnopus androsaceus JB14]|uniref:CxC2-like cysteine cluster KDZ transposase-associated domain-containing protein n=1 Tax=Gymnopus androsaceus JB14 TaxID=1447944 RepID=A0A6A4HNN1_9AGAR|nr:hypothetical protein BT96DRAFT_957616 [Gymnopus androsaceus JB14]